MLIANPAACAESISLHKVCHHAVYLDRSFNCAHYLQSLDRIHRLGLSKDQKTYYYLFQSAGSIDEIVDTRLREKMKRMRDIVEADLPGTLPGYWSEDLGSEELVDLQLVEEHLEEVLRGSERQANEIANVCAIYAMLRTDRIARSAFRVIRHKVFAFRFTHKLQTNC